MTCTHIFARKTNQSPNESFVWKNINASSADVASAHFIDRIFGLMPKSETHPMPVATMLDYFEAFSATLDGLGHKAKLSVMPHADKEFCRKLQNVFGGENAVITRTPNGESVMMVGAFDTLHSLFNDWISTSRGAWSAYAHGKIGEINRNAGILTGIANNGGMSGRQYITPHYPR